MHRAPFLILATAFVVALVAPSSASQTTPRTQQPPQTQTGAKPGTTQMTMDCQQMMQAHQKVMQDMQAMDARLDTLVQQMNSATGQAKTDATAAVVNEMVTQRKTMRESMQRMQMQAMRHMAEHMQAGGGDAMMNCPMMKDMK